MKGLYYEDFRIGMVFEHALHRTITEADNVTFTSMTHNPSPLHLDAEYMKTTEFGQPIGNSCLTLSLMVGVSVGDTTMGTSVANLGWDEVRFPKPVFHGDTLHFETEVFAMRDSKSRPGEGIITFVHRGYNQRDELIASCKRSALMIKQPDGSSDDDQRN